VITGSFRTLWQPPDVPSSAYLAMHPSLEFLRAYCRAHELHASNVVDLDELFALEVFLDWAVCVRQAAQRQARARAVRFLPQLDDARFVDETHSMGSGPTPDLAHAIPVRAEQLSRALVTAPNAPGIAA